MARYRTTAGKHHRPRHIARATVQLTVDEIGNSAKKQPDRHRLDDDVGKGEQADSAGAREEYDGERDAERAAMKRHAAAPDIERLYRVSEVISRVVEQHVADAAAEDDAERRPDEKIVDILGAHEVWRPPDEGQAVAPTDHQPDDIGKRVPANCQ